MKRIALFIIILASTFGVTSTLITHRAEAANLYVVADKTTAAVNDIINATIYLNTAGVAVNNSEGVLSFSPSVLSVESVSMTSSVFSIWVEQPTFSNTAGTISFNGGVPNPGFNGTQGAVLRVRLRALRTGSSPLAFSSSGVYANDGLGTNVATPGAGTAITVTSATSPLPTPPPVTVPATEPAPERAPVVGPPTPEITSPDVPDTENWYSLTEALFAWDVPRDVTAVQLLHGSIPTSVPSVLYAPPIGNKKLTKLTDGVQYLHVRFRKNGVWGPTAHRKIKIDLTAPEDIEASPSTANDIVTLAASGKDTLSGISKFVVLKDGQSIAEASVQNTEGTAAITLPPLAEGSHDLVIRAFDKAGNSSDQTITIEAPTIEPPRFITYPESVKKGETIDLVGATYGHTDVRIFMQIGDAAPVQAVVTSNSEGMFTFTSEAMKNPGTVSIWAEAVRGAGAVSAPSGKIYVIVNKSSLSQVSENILNVLYAVIPLVLVILGLIFTTYLGFHKFRVVRAKLVRDLNETEKDAHKIFEIIKEDVKQSIKLFERAGDSRSLTPTEKRTLGMLEKDLEEAEKYFSERIKIIKKRDL